MKNINNLFVLLATSLLATTGCKEKTNPTPDLEPTKVSFGYSIEGYQTKANDSTFESGSQISIFATEQDNNFANNVKYTFDGKEFASENSIVIEDEQLAYYAMFPYSSDASTSGVFTAATDQSAADDYSNSDLMTAYVAPTNSATPTLNFSHAMVQIEVNITNSDIDTDGATFSVMAKNQVNYDIELGEVEATGEDVDIAGYSSEEDTFSAIVAPQTISGDVNFLCVEIDGVQYYGKTTEAVELISGTRYICSATIENGEITYTSSLGEWNDGDIYVEPVDLTAVVKSVSVSDIIVTVDKGTNTDNYYVGLLTPSMYDDDPIASAEALVDQEINQYNTDFSKADGMVVFAENGDVSLDKGWNLSAGSNYVIIVCCVSAEGVISSNVVAVETATEALELLDPIGFTVEEAGSDFITIKTNPSAEVVNYVAAPVLNDVYQLEFLGENIEVANYVVNTLKYNNIDITKANGTTIFNGAATIDLSEAWTIEAETLYRVLVFGIDATGSVTTEVAVQDVTTLAKEEESGTLEVSSLYTSENNITVNVKVKGGVGNYYLGAYLKSKADMLFSGDADMIAESLITKAKANNVDFTTPDGVYVFNNSTYFHDMNSGWTFEAGTEYIVLAFGVDAEGNITTDVATCIAETTAAASGSSEEYEAWLGTWTVTSTSSYGASGEAISFDVVIKEEEADEKFKVVGWGVSEYCQDEGSYYVDFNADNGNMEFAAYTYRSSYWLESTEYTMYSAAFGIVGDGTEPVAITPATSERFDAAMSAVINSDGTEATVTGATGTASDGTAYTVTFVDAMLADGNGNPKYWPIADAYAQTLNPIGPYTMVKKTATEAPAMSAKSVVPVAKTRLAIEGKGALRR